MAETDPNKTTVREFSKRHGKITLLGLLVILVPVAVVSKAFEHAHGLFSKAVDATLPQIRMLGDMGVTAGIVLAILAACWLLGWLMWRSERGRRWIEWEKAKLLPRSPFWKKHSARLKSKEKEEEPDEMYPALARIGGEWQPAMVVAERAGTWATVFVPEAPSASVGRLYCVTREQVLRLEVPLDEFRKSLTRGGRGSEDWLGALAEASVAQA